MARPAKRIDATPKIGGYGLDCLRDRAGWQAAGNAWTNTELDITVEQIAPHRFRLTTAGHDQVLTSATGCLVVIDQVAARAATDAPASA